MPTRRNYPKPTGRVELLYKTLAVRGSYRSIKGLVKEQSFVDSAHLSLRTLFCGIRYNFDKLEKAPPCPLSPEQHRPLIVLWPSEVPCVRPSAAARPPEYAF